MTPAEFILRARAKGCRVDVSGNILFVSDGNVIVRIDQSGHYAIREVKHGQDMNYKISTAAACSRALHLPRR